jgi:tRNA threonylcarbamoyladenosine biosynthesis protein TsaB
MAVILSIETSTGPCSVALHHNGNFIAAAEVHKEYSHASKLAPLVKQVVKLADVTMSQVDAVAVSSGPGSYTGLRIGTSLAKGICYALDIPLLAVPTLQIIAYRVSQMNIADAFLCPMIDARRMEVYSQVFDYNMEEQEPVQPIIIEAGAFDNYLAVKPVIFFGNGAMKCSQIIVHKNATFMPGINPSATSLGELAHKKFVAGDIENLFEFVPHYLKEFFVKRKSEV